MAIRTKDHKLGGWKEHKFTIISCCMQKCDISQSAGASMGESISLSFQNLRAMHIPWIMASSSIFKPNNKSFLCKYFSHYLSDLACVATSLSDLNFSAYFVHLQGHLWLPWAHPDNPGQDPYFKVSWLTILIPYAILIFHVKQLIYRLWRLQCRHWGHYSVLNLEWIQDCG